MLSNSQYYAHCNYVREEIQLSYPSNCFSRISYLYGLNRCSSILDFTLFWNTSTAVNLDISGEGISVYHLSLESLLVNVSF